MLPENDSESVFQENRPHQIDLESLFYKYRYILFFFLIGVILIGLGSLSIKKNNSLRGGVEIIDNTQTDNLTKEIVVEVAGQVVNPGVYKLTNGSRINDALIAAGGVNENADRVWMEKNLNRAAKLIDGQKIYVLAKGESNNQSTISSAKNSDGDQSISSVLRVQGSGLININTASQKELESLSGIGPVYALNIIEHRPYSNSQELVSKGVLKTSTYKRIKDKISVN